MFKYFIQVSGEVVRAISPQVWEETQKREEPIWSDQVMHASIKTCFFGVKRSKEYLGYVTSIMGNNGGLDYYSATFEEARAQHNNAVEVFRKAAERGAKKYADPKALEEFLSRSDEILAEIKQYSNYRPPNS